MKQLSERYLQDLAVGQTYGSGRLRIERERALAFAAEFDPQPFHLDEAAAGRSIFGGLTASGWHTTAVTMRLLIEGELHPAGGFVGVGLDECHWPRPVRPGDELRVECEVLEVRPFKIASEAGPDQHQNDHPEPGRRGCVGACVAPGRAVPEGHSAGVATVGSKASVGKKIIRQLSEAKSETRDATVVEASRLFRQRT